LRALGARTPIARDDVLIGLHTPQDAAVVRVPPGLQAKVEGLLFQMMTGAVEVLNEAGCALVAGHTGEGRELALGFAINGLIDEGLAGVMRKGGMPPTASPRCSRPAVWPQRRDRPGDGPGRVAGADRVRGVRPLAVVRPGRTDRAASAAIRVSADLDLAASPP
jgi:hypothetical protein